MASGEHGQDTPAPHWPEEVERVLASPEYRRDPERWVIDQRYLKLAARPLGEGSFGVVYRAFDRKHRCVVAVKLLTRAAGQAAARFAREVQALAALRHDHIVRLLDSGSHRGQPYLVMEFVEGRTLAQLGRIEPGRAAALVAQAAQGLGHAHRRQIVHRDVKPQNILVDGEDQARVVDFGLVRLREQEDAGGSGRLTFTVGQMGTPYYRSPEQVVTPKDTDARSDVYSLGATLYELLVGEPPFLPPKLEEQVRFRRPRSPRRSRPELSKELAAICLKCLEKRPGDRYPTGTELALELERWTRGEPVTARPVPGVVRLWRNARRHRVMSGLIGLFALLLLAAGLIVFGVWVTKTAETEEALREAEQERDLAQAARDNARLAEARAHITAGQAQLASGYASLEAQQYASAARAFAGAIAAVVSATHTSASLAREEDGQDAALRARFAEVAGRVARVQRIGARGAREALARHGLRWSSRGSAFVAFSKQDEALITVSDHRPLLQRWDPARGTRETLAAGGARVNDMLLSPDGALVALGGADGRTSLRRTANGALVGELIPDDWGRQIPRAYDGRTDPRGICRAAFSADGELLAVAHDDGRVRVWDVARRERVATLDHAEQELGPVFSCAFHPEDRDLVVTGGRRSIQVWDLQGPTRRRLLADPIVSSLIRPRDPEGALHPGSAHDGFVHCLRFQPGGAYLVSTSFDGTVKLWETNNWRLEQRLQEHTDAVTDAAFSPDGSLLATGGWDGSPRLWRVRPPLPDGGRLRPGVRLLHRFPARGSRIRRCAFSPDGERLLVAASDLSEWDVGSNVPRTLESVAAELNSLSVSPDGRYLVASGDLRGLQLWELGGDRYPREIEGPQRELCNAERALFLGGGRGLAVGRPDGELLLFDLAQERVLWQRTVGDTVADIAVAPDGRELAVATHGHGLTLWELDGESLILRRPLALRSSLDERLPGGTSCAFGPRELLACASGPNLWLRPPRGETEVLRDSQAASEAGEPRERGRWLRPFAGEHAAAPIACAVAPAGALAALGDELGRVFILELPAGRLQHRLERHRGAIRHLAFAPDGTVLASASADTSVFLWDAESGQRLRALAGDEDEVLTCAFIASGPLAGSLATAGSQAGVNLWRVRTPEVSGLLEDPLATVERCLRDGLAGRR